MIDKPDFPPGQAKRLTDQMAAVKRLVFSGSPAPCEAIDEIVRIARQFDSIYHSNLDIGFIEDKIVDVIWEACGSPVIGTAPPPPNPMG